MSHTNFIKVADKIWDSKYPTATAFPTMKFKEKLQLKYPNSYVSPVHSPTGWFVSIRFFNDEDEALFIMKESI